MSDSLTLEEERKKEALNTNAPSTAAITPFIQQITQGNPGAQVSAEETARKTDRGVVDTFIKGVQTSASQIDAAFKAGQSSVSAQPTSSSINTGAASLGRAASDLLGIKADADARIAGKDALAEAQQTQAMQRRLITSGVNPDSKALDDALSVVGSSLTSATSKVKDIAAMRKVGFFDNPAEYLYNNIINIPLTTVSAARDISQAKIVQGGLATFTAAMKDSAIVDAAYFSSRDNERAGLVAQTTLAAGKAAAMQPLTTALQQSLGALNLKNAEGQLGVAQGHLALAQSAEGRAADLHPLQKQAADLNNRIKQIEIDAAPATQKQRLLSIQNLENQIAREPDEVKRMQLANQKSELEVQEAQFKVANQPLQKKILEANAGYIDALKTGQIQTNEENLLASQQRREFAAKVMKDKETAVGLANLYLQAKGYKGDLTSLEGLPKDRAELLVTEGMKLAQGGGLGTDNDPYATVMSDRKLGISVGNPENSPPGWQVGRQTVEQAIARVEKELDTLVPGQNKPTTEERQNRLHVGTAQKLIEDQLQRGWGPNNGAFSTPSLDVLTKDPKASANPIVKELTPLSIDGSGNPVSVPVTGNLLMGTAAALIAKGKISEADAAKALQALGQNIQDQGNVTFGYKVNGIPLAPNNFNMMYTQPGKLWGGTQEIANFKSIADTQLRIRRYMAAQKVRESTAGVDFSGQPSSYQLYNQGNLENDLQKKASGR